MSKQSNTPQQRKAAAQIYRAAAKMAEDDPRDDIIAYWAMIANERAGEPITHTVQCAQIQEVFGERYGDAFGQPNALVIEERILALCFMAAVVERP